MWDLIVSVPDHCLSFYFTPRGRNVGIEFRQYCRQHPLIYDFIDGMRPGFFRFHKSKITEEVILSGLMSGALFGMLEVDIQVLEQ